MANTTYIGVVRDHSASMTRVVKGAIADYNLTIDGIKDSVLNEGQNARVTVVECGVGSYAKVVLKEHGVPVGRVAPLSSYPTSGNRTPLWDSVKKAIEACRQAAVDNHDDEHEGTAYLLMVITDGQDNTSATTASQMSREIKSLQETGRWTFVFRVPVGYKRALVSLGIPDGNIIEWEQTTKALETSTRATVAAVQSFFKGRSAGVKSSNSFYANAANLTESEVKQNLTDITRGVKTAFVSPRENGVSIKDFCLDKFGDFTPGAALYQLTKAETVQDHKTIVIRELSSGKFYTGPSARQLLGLPRDGNIRVIPANTHGRFDIFVQSTSFNRKLVGGTEVVYVRYI
jgi:hypothetical protein